MVKIALCDDDTIFLNFLEQSIASYFEKYKINIFIDKFNNGSDLVSEFENNNENYDVVFMDIDLNNENGLDIISQLRVYDKSFLLIFLSSMESEVFSVFQYNTFRFVRKNFLEKELYEALKNLKSLIAENSLKHEFKTKNALIKLSVNEIYYFIYCKRTLEVHTSDNCFEVLRTKFKEVEKEFSNKGFLNINRGILVNLNFVKVIKKDELVLDNEVVLSVSRYKMPLLKQYFFNRGVGI